MDRQRLFEVLETFARTLVTDYRVGDMLSELCDHAVELLEVTGAGVMVTDEDGHLRFVSASDDTVQQIEHLQIELREGPCLAAYQSGEQVVVGDLRDDDRFPRFTPRAVSQGMCAVFSFPMRAGEQRVGALNLYRDQARPFEPEDVRAGQLLADVATTYILNTRALEQSTRLAEQLQHALDSRVVIEQAKGRLAEQLGVDVGTAFQLLRGHARSHGRRLHAVADDIVVGRLRLEPATANRSGTVAEGRRP